MVINMFLVNNRLKTKTKAEGLTLNKIDGGNSLTTIMRLDSAKFQYCVALKPIVLRSCLLSPLCCPLLICWDHLDCLSICRVSSGLLRSAAWLFRSFVPMTFVLVSTYINCFLFCFIVIHLFVAGIHLWNLHPPFQSALGCLSH